MMDFLEPIRASPSKPSGSSSSVAGNSQSQDEQSQQIPTEEGSPLQEAPHSSKPAPDTPEPKDCDWPSHVSASYFVVIADLLIVKPFLIAMWTLTFWAKFAWSV